MLRELAGGRNEVQRRGKVYLTVLVVLQLSVVYLILRRREINVQGLSRKVERFSLFCKRPLSWEVFQEIQVLRRKPRWELRRWEERGKSVLCVGGEERVELLLGWKGHEDVNLLHWCWDLLVSFPGTWASLSVTATLGKSRKYLFKDSVPPGCIYFSKTLSMF